VILHKEQGQLYLYIQWRSKFVGQQCYPSEGTAVLQSYAHSLIQVKREVKVSTLIYREEGGSLVLGNMAKILPDTDKVVSVNAKKAYRERMSVAPSTFNLNT
jgi:hypothetical protein